MKLLGMRECRDRIFLTLVVASFVIMKPTFSWAAPGEGSSPSIIKEPIQDVYDPALSEKSNYSRFENQILQLNVGYLVGKITKKIDEEDHTSVGISYDWRDIDQNYWTVGAKWLNTKAAWIEGGKKFMIFPDHLYEPYYKLSVSHFLEPDDSIAGLTRIDSFKTSISFGVLDLFTLGRIINLEIGAQWGISGFAGHAQAGSQWSF